MLSQHNPLPDHECSSSKCPKIVYVERIEKGRYIAWKAAITGTQLGVTRKIGPGVKTVDADPEAGTEAVYLVDTPGVFVPFVPTQMTCSNSPSAAQQ